MECDRCVYELGTPITATLLSPGYSENDFPEQDVVFVTPATCDVSLLSSGEKSLIQLLYIPFAKNCMHRN